MAIPDRKFELVGDTSVKCDRDCGNYDSTNQDYHAFGTGLKVDKKNTLLTLCSAAPPRGSTKPAHWTSDSVKNCRVCLIKQLNFDPSSNVEGV